MAYRDDEEEKVDVGEGAEEETLAETDIDGDELEEEELLGVDQEKEWE